MKAFVVVGTFEAKPGRPKVVVCKRGHTKQAGYTYCRECKQLKDRLRYAQDAEFRRRKRDHAKQYRADFKEQFGFNQSELYR